MSNEPAPQPLRDVRFTPEFKRNLRQLAKKYRHIRSDIQPLLDALIAGELPGDQIPSIGFPIYKFVFETRMLSGAKVVATA